MYQFLNSPETRKEKRLIWSVTRSVMENMGFVHKRSGKMSKSNWGASVSEDIYFFLKNQRLLSAISLKGSNSIMVFGKLER